MKHHSTLFLLLSISFQSIFSQNVDVFWGKEYPTKRTGYTYLLGATNSNILAYKATLLGNKISTLKYNKNDLMLVGETEITGKPQNSTSVISNDHMFLGFRNMKDKIIFTGSKYDKSTDLNSYFVQEIDATGALKGSLTKLASISAPRKGNAGSFFSGVSDDSTSLLLVMNPPYEKYAGEKFQFKIYDQTLSEKKNLEIGLPFKDKDIAVLDYILTNDQSIYILIKIFKEKKSRSKGTADYYYEVVGVDTEGEGKVTQYELKLPGKYLDDISFSYDEETKKMVCAGFYGDMEKNSGGLKGVFFIRINKDTKQIEASSTKKLDNSFVAELTTKRKADKDKGVSKSFEVKDLIRKSDGGVVIVAEYAYDYVVRTCRTSQNGGQTCSNTYHYIRNNIIVININPEGQIKWLSNIPKSQHTTNDRGAFSSYLLSVLEDKMYFMYNENPKNILGSTQLPFKDLKPMVNPGKSTCVVVELDEMGNFDKTPLFNSKEGKFVMMPEDAIQISETEIIVPTLSRGMYCCMIPLKKTMGRLVKFTFR